MTGYLYAAIVCRALALLAIAATVWLPYTAPWWVVAITAWVAFLGVFLGGAMHLAHRRTLNDPSTRTRGSFLGGRLPFTRRSKETHLA